MPQHIALLAQLIFYFRSRGTGPEGGYLTFLVQVEQFVHASQ